MTATAKDPHTWGTGRRKTAVARVRIREGTGQFLVNGLEMTVYFPLEVQRMDVRAPLTSTDMASRIDVFVNVRGSGKLSQSGAVMLGLARASRSSPRPRLGAPRRRVLDSRLAHGRTQEVRPQEGPQELPVLQALILASGLSTGRLPDRIAVSDYALRQCCRN